MVLDIQTVHHIFKKYSSSKCTQTVFLHTDLTSPSNINRKWLFFTVNRKFFYLIPLHQHNFPTDNLVGFGALRKKQLCFHREVHLCPIPQSVQKLIHSWGSLHLLKSSLLSKRYLPSSLSTPLFLNRYLKTSCLKFITVGNTLLDFKLSKIAVCSISAPAETNSAVGCGFQYVLQQNATRRQSLKYPSQTVYVTTYMWMSWHQHSQLHNNTTQSYLNAKAFRFSSGSQLLSKEL